MIIDILRKFDDKEYELHWALVDAWNDCEDIKSWYQTFGEWDEEEDTYIVDEADAKKLTELQKYVTPEVTEEFDELTSQFKKCVTHFRSDRNFTMFHLWSDEYDRVLWAHKNDYQYVVIWNPINDNFYFGLKPREAVKMYDAVWNHKCDREFLTEQGWHHCYIDDQDELEWCIAELDEFLYESLRTYHDHDTLYSCYFHEAGYMAYKLRFDGPDEEE